MMIDKQQKLDRQKKLNQFLSYRDPFRFNWVLDQSFNTFLCAILTSIRDHNFFLFFFTQDVIWMVNMYPKDAKCRWVRIRVSFVGAPVIDWCVWRKRVRYYNARLQNSRNWPVNVVHVAQTGWRSCITFQVCLFPFSDFNVFYIFLPKNEFLKRRNQNQILSYRKMHFSTWFSSTWQAIQRRSLFKMHMSQRNLRLSS